MTANEKAHTHNSTLAIGGVSSPLDSFVVTESSVLRTNFYAKRPAHRQSAKRYLNSLSFKISECSLTDGRF